MNNDLISREALKKALYDFLSENSTTCDWEDIFNVIDNAPTVDKAILKERNVNKCLNCEHCCYSSMNSKGEITIMCNLGTGSCKPERPQGDLADEVWKLYEKHHSHLATHVIEFGDELKELLGKYRKGGAE